eukprot:c7180_g1_i1.p1 GENE.c7180_g1_i1~~c7180_g1_i1.p1  ORF type:complete len:152 (+),score=29.32 c7180_g1_i1:631-1086(+)
MQNTNGSSNNTCTCHIATQHDTQQIQSLPFHLHLFCSFLSFILLPSVHSPFSQPCVVATSLCFCDFAHTCTLHHTFTRLVGCTHQCFPDSPTSGHHSIPEKFLTKNRKKEKCAHDNTSWAQTTEIANEKANPKHFSFAADFCHSRNSPLLD